MESSHHPKVHESDYFLLATPDIQKKIWSNIHNKKYLLLLFLIITPLLLISLIAFTVISFNSLNKGRDIDVPTKEEKEEEEHDIIINTDDLSFITLLPNEKFIRPLTDSNRYEMIKLENNLEILWISNRKAIRSGFSFVVDISDFKKKHERTINYDYFDNFAQYFITSLSEGGVGFNRGISHYAGNFWFNSDSNKNMHLFYCDVETQGFKNTLESFHEMMYKNNILSSIEEKDIEKRLSSDKINYDINHEPKLSGNYNERFVKIIDMMLWEDTSITKDTLLTTDKIKDLLKLSYNNTSNIRLSIISNYSISEWKHLIVPIWNNSISSDIQKETPTKQRSNSVNKAFWYLTNNTYSTLDLIIPWGQDSKYSINQYIVYMIRDEGELSLENILKSKSLIYKLTARLETISKERHYLWITLKLTDSGSTGIDSIMQIIYNFFKQLYNQKTYEKTYKDIQLIIQQNFNFKIVENYKQYLTDITGKLWYLPQNEINQILNSGYNLPDYNYDTIKEVLAPLTDLSNYSMFIGFNSFDKLTLATKQEEYSEYLDDSVQYFTKQINIDRLSKTLINWEFVFKGKNNYITKEKKIRSIDSNYFKTNIFEYQPIYYDWNEKVPTNELWYRNDQCFKIPKIEAYFFFDYAKMGNFYKLLKLSYLKSSFSAMEILFFNRVKQNVQNKFISAEEAGNELKLSFEREKGIILKVSAYKDIIVQLISDVFEVIYSSANYSDLNYHDFEPITYGSANEKIIDFLFYYNEETLKFKKEANELLLQENGIIIEPFTVLPKYTNALSDYFNYLFKGEGKIVSLWYGDLGEDNEITKSIGNIIKKYNAKEHIVENVSSTFFSWYRDPQRNYGRCIIWQYDNPFWWGEKNENYMINAFFLGNHTANIDVMTDLLIYTFKDIFHNKYDITSYHHFVEKIHEKNSVFLKLVKSSNTVSPERLFNETSEDLIDLLGKIRNVTNEKFDLMKEYLLKKSEYQPLSWKEKADNAWFEIYQKSDYFDVVQDYKIELMNLKRIDFINFVKEVIKKNLYLSFQFYADGKLYSMDKKVTMYNHFREKMCQIKRKGNAKRWEDDLYDE